MNKLIRLYDRSRVVNDWKCPRERFWTYEYGGRGVVSQSTHLELYIGTTVHDGLAAIATQHLNNSLDIDAIAKTAFKQVFEALLDESAGESEYDSIQFANEQATLVEGLLRGFYKVVWPNLIESYPKIVAIEQELLFKHDGAGKAHPDGLFQFMSKPDLVVEDKEGNLFYIEYKTTSSRKDDWINAWSTAVQLHSTMRAIEQTLGTKPTGVVVQGLYKGYQSYGKQSSPFCYGYGRNPNPPFTSGDLRYDYYPGYKRTPVWEMEGGVAGWIDGMPDTLLADQFPATPPIFINESLVDDFFQQRAIREAEINMGMEMLEKVNEDGIETVLNGIFPQKFDQCNPAFGKACSKRQLCFGRKGTDPIDAGFIWREPHHTPEMEKFNAQDSDSDNRV